MEKRKQVFRRALSLGLLLAMVSGPVHAESPLSSPTPELKPPATPSPHAVPNTTLDPELRDIIQNAPRHESIPDDSIALLLVDEKVVIDETGTATRDIREVVKIMTESGILRDPIELPYLEGRDTVEILTARTIKPNGQVFDVDPTLIQDSTILESASLFANLRFKRFMHSNMAPGDVVELRYRLVEKPTVPGVAAIFFEFAPYLRTLRSRLEISLPEGVPGQFMARLLRDRQPQVVTEAGRTIYRWDVGESDQSPGYDMALPPPRDTEPFIFFSTMPDWNTFSKWYVPYFKTSIKADDPAIQAKAKELLAGIPESERRDRIQALYDFVANEVSYVQISLDESGYKPYPADFVLRNLYGDCKAKSGLLISLLQASGIEAHGVLIKPSIDGQFVKNFPAPDFSHAIVAIPMTTGGYRYVDPTLPFASVSFLDPFLQDRDVLVLDTLEAHFEKTPLLSQRKSSLMKDRTEWTFDEKGVAQWSGVQELSGIVGVESRIQFSQMNPSMHHEFIERSIRAVYQSTRLTDSKLLYLTDVSKPFTIKVSGTSQDAAQWAGPLLLFQLPPTVPPQFKDLIGYEQRFYPLFLPQPVNIQVENHIEIPAGMAPKWVPEDVALHTPFSQFNRTTEQSEGRMIVRNMFAMGVGTMEVAQYPELKTFLEQVFQAEDEKIIFEPVAG